MSGSESELNSCFYVHGYSEFYREVIVSALDQARFMIATCDFHYEILVFPIISTISEDYMQYLYIPA